MMINRWLGIMMALVLAVGTVVAQEVSPSAVATVNMGAGSSGPSVLGSDLEEFKRFEAFRSAQREAAEQQQSASAKEAYDDFQLFKQFRELRRKQTQSVPLPSAPKAGDNVGTSVPALTTPTSPEVPVGGGASSGPSVSPSPSKSASRLTEDDLKPSGARSTFLTDDAASAYSRYRFMHMIEHTNHKAPTPATAPLSFGWDWVTNLGLANATYSNASTILAVHGFSFGFGGRWVFPLAGDTSLMLGPEIRWVSGSLKGDGLLGISSSFPLAEYRQSMVSLHVPVQIQQRMGRFNVAAGFYLSRPLFADETGVATYGYKVVNDMMGLLQGLQFGSTVSLSYQDMGYQLGLYVDLPHSDLVKSSTGYTSSRLASYGLFVAARL